MNPLLEFVPADTDLPDEVRRAYAGAMLLAERDAVAAALDRLAVRLTARYQSQRPHLVAIGSGGAYLGGALLARMVFPCRVKCWQPDTPVPAVDQDVPVLVLHCGDCAPLLARVRRDLDAAGVREIVCVTMTPTPGAELAALDVSGSAGVALLGCGHEVDGYGANLPALYGYSPSDTATNSD